MASDNIKVAIRIRPLIKFEKEKKLSVQWTVQNNTIYQTDECSQRNGELYSFDYIFGVDKSNEEIYADIVKDFVKSSLNGVNSTIFAYGQTSSGKTFTMFGNEEAQGIVPLAIENIFDSISNCKNRKYLLRISYVEIYNERINDLLDPSNKDIKIREYFTGAIGLQNIKEEIVSSREQVYELLKRGTLNRHIGVTNMNERSSRSHTIFKIVIESAEIHDFDGDYPVQISNLNLVDLAGSERVAQTKATGVRLKEGGHINKSLSALGLVIRQLSDGQEYVNFRDSKLTRLLQHSLGGNAKTLIIATITLTSVENTNSTLSFAQRAKAVRNKPQINEVLSDSAANKRYAQLNAALKKRLEEQLLINKKLEHTKDENSKEILRLQEQMYMLENFQHGKKSECIELIPKRRHTIAYSSQKQPLGAILEETYEGVYNSENEVALQSQATKILTAPSIPASTKKCATLRGEVSTPKNFLRTRIRALEQEYDELVMYTRDEKNLLTESSKKVEKLENQLILATQNLSEVKNQRKIEEEFIMNQLTRKFKMREEELLNKITYLEKQIENKNTPKTNEGNNHDSIKLNVLRKPVENIYLKDHLLDFSNEEDIKYLQNQLTRLQDILSCEFVEDYDSTLKKTKIEDSVQQIIESFSSKIKTSKEIIENEIWKQINSFNQVEEKLNDTIMFPNELDSFNTLLKELLAFENDVSIELENNTEEENIKDLKILIKIYESLLKKNELIGRCSEKILSLQDQMKINCDYYAKELNAQKIIIDGLNLELTEKDSALSVMENNISSFQEERDGFKEKSSTYEAQISTYKKKLSDIYLENDTLKKEIELMKSTINNYETDIEKHKEYVTSTNNKINELETQLQKIKTLEDEFAGANIQVEEYQQTNQQLKSELKICQQKIKTLENEFSDANARVEEYKEINQQLKNEIEIQQQKIKILENEFSDANTMIEEYKEINQQLKSEIEIQQQKIKTLKNKVERADSVVGEYKQLNQQLKSELEIERQKIKTLEDESAGANIGVEVYKQINEKLKNELEIQRKKINSLENYVAKNNMEIEEYKRIKKQLRSEQEILECKLRTCENNGLDLQALLEDKEAKIIELNEVKRKFEITLCNVIEHFIKEEKSLLLIRQTQEQRNDFKDTRKNLKANCTDLKGQLQLLQNNTYNLDQITEMLIKTNAILKEYYQLDKSVLQSQIKQVDLSNKAYLNEISVLKKYQEESSRKDCSNCNCVKTELCLLKQKLTYKEKKLAETLNQLQHLEEKFKNFSDIGIPCLKCTQLEKKNAELQKQINNQMGEIVDLQLKIYREEDRKTDLDVILRKALYQNDTSNKISTEVQCNLLNTDETLIKKYQMLKLLCQERKKEIESLKKRLK